MNKEYYIFSIDNAVNILFISTEYGEIKDLETMLNVKGKWCKKPLISKVPMLPYNPWKIECIGIAKKLNVKELNSITLNGIKIYHCTGDCC